MTGATGVDKTYDTTTALPTGASGFTASSALGSDVVTIAAAVFVFVNLVVDLLYPLLDPRISHARGGRIRVPARAPEVSAI